MMRRDSTEHDVPPGATDARRDSAPWASRSSATATGGPNLARNVAERPELELVGAVRARRDRARRAFSQRYPGVPGAARPRRACSPTTRSKRSLVATPPQTHYALVKRALEAGKHVLVEKPLATTSARRARARRARRAPTASCSCPGHTFVYSPAVNTVRDLIRDGVRRRGLLRHVVAHEPRQVPARRRGLRPGAARPVDPPVLARRAGRAGRRDGAQRLPGRRPGDRVPDADLRRRAPPRTSRSPGSRRARCARWSSSAASGWCSHDDTAVRRARPRLRPRAWTSSQRRRTSASTS